MKKTIITICLSVVSIILAAQAPLIQWQISLGGTSDEFANAIRITSDSGYIATGYTYSNDGDVSGNHSSFGQVDFWVVKLNETGALQWQKCYGGSRDDKALDIRQTYDSGYVIAGFSNSDDGDITGHHGGTDTADYWIVKTDSAGAIQWERSLGGSGYEAAYSIRQTTDSGYIVTGFTESVDGDITFNYGNSDYWLVKLDKLGNIQWQQSYGGTSFDNGTSVILTADNGYLVAGNAYSADSNVSFNHGLSDYWVVKLDSSGNIQWEKTYGGSNADFLSDVQQTTDGGFIISGNTASTDGDVTPHLAVTEYWILKTNPTGNIQWQYCYGGQGSEEPFSIEQQPDNGYIIAGHATSMDGDVTGNHGVWDCWIVKLDSSGLIQWEQCYGGPWDDGATGIHRTSDGGYIIGGHSMLTGGDVTGTQGAHDFWVIKLTSPTGISELESENKSIVSPNPFTDLLTVSIFSYDQNEIIIYDPLGRIVLQQSFVKSTSLTTSSLAKGIYFYMINNNMAVIATGKLLKN